jgi:hypothetical protein
MRSALILCALGVFSAMPLLAADPIPVAAVPAVPDKKICRSEEVTGSNLPETHCHTKAEWAQLEKQHEAEIRSLRDGGHWDSNGH